MKRCTGRRADGGACNAWPLQGEDHCLFHSPERAEEASEARRLGGLRRRRERTLAGAYDLQPLDTVASLRRLLEIATIDVLALDNSLARSRTLVQVVATGSRLLEVGEMEARLAALEAAQPRAVGHAARRDGSLLDEPLVFPGEAHA